jgi:hypothetical protein
MAAWMWRGETLICLPGSKSTHSIVSILIYHIDRCHLVNEQLRSLNQGQRDGDSAGAH